MSTPTPAPSADAAEVLEIALDNYASADRNMHKQYAITLAAWRRVTAENAVLKEQVVALQTALASQSPEVPEPVKKDS